MTASELHKDAVIIDGLVISNWSRSVFESMKRGGITAATCTCSIWENFRDTMENIAKWKKWFHEHSDILLQVHTTEDISRAKAEGKVGIILGWQNTSGIDTEISFLRLARDLGVRVMQLTYNTQNFVGTGCWENRDTGLSDFGREVIDGMNEAGILVDLSHCGQKTSEEAILHSKKPVAYTHICPAALRDHPRNKTDEQLRFIVERGGFIGFATMPRFLPRDAETTVDDCVDAIEHVLSVAGEDSVGIGTDFTQDQPAEWFDWLHHDKGTARDVMPHMKGIGPLMPKGLTTLAEMPNLTAAMERRGWPEPRIRKVMGENWLRLLKDVWGA